MELDVALKCSALHPLCKCYKTGMWQPNQRWAWPWQ